MIKLKFVNIILSILFINTISIAQDDKSEKEIIIIEKMVDPRGNIISKNTKRYNGTYTEEEVQELIEETSQSNPAIDYKGFGFKDGFQDLFNSGSQKSTIGLRLEFNGGQGLVTKVKSNSGADEADIRIGDQIIAINGIAISSIDDINDILAEKSSGDKIKMVIFRDGQELEKDVELSGENNSQFFFNLPEDGELGFLDNNKLGFLLGIDSLFGDLMEQGDLFEGLNFDTRGQDKSDKDDYKKDRASLGIFIDEKGRNVIISEVVEDSPADRAGLQKGDVISRLDDNIMTSFREVSAYINTKRTGDPMTIEIERNGNVKLIEVLLE